MKLEKFLKKIDKKTDKVLDLTTQYLSDLRDLAVDDIKVYMDSFETKDKYYLTFEYKIPIFKLSKVKK